MNGHQRIAALVGTALVALGVAAAPLAFAQPSVPPAATAAPVAATAVDNYGSCLAGQKQGDLLLMIDESGSLTESDPSAARVTAANYLLDRLSTFAASAGVTLDVAVSGFSTEFAPALPWTAISSASVDELRSAVDDFRTRTAGRDTDYWTALDRARAYLADRGQGPDGATRCQAIAWFTDGKLDFDPRSDFGRSFAPGVDFDSAAGVQQGVGMALESICRQGGIADQIRSSGIVIFGIGLTGTATGPDFDSMRSIVTGEPGPSGPCGNVTSPRPGEFYSADDLDGLLFAFDALSTPGQAPLATDEGICQVQVCEDAKHRFVLDDSIGSVDVLASGSVSGLQPVLIGPSGQSVPLDASSPQTRTLVDGSNVGYQWESDKTLRVTMTKAPAGQWSGAWAIAFVDPSGASGSERSKTNIHISGNLFPVWTNTEVTLHSGEIAENILLGMVDGDERPVDPQQILGTAVLSASLVDDEGREVATTRDLSKNEIGTVVDLDLSNVDPGQDILRLTLAVTTAAATDADGVSQPGTELTPRTVDIPVEVGTPIGYPTVVGALDFGDIEEAGTATSSLTVTGPGCVWVTQSTRDDFTGLPADVGNVSVAGARATSKETCLSVDEGQTATLDVGLTTENVASGALTGAVEVIAASSDDLDATVPQEVRFTAQLDRPLNEPVFIGALVGALLIGIGLPFLFLYVAKWFTARIPALPLVAEEIPITVESGSVLRDGVPFALRERDLLTPVQGLHRPARRLTVGSVSLETHIGRSPFGVGYVSAEKSSVLSASSDTPASTGKPPRARLGLAIHNKWILLHDPAGPADAGTVVVLAGGTTTPVQRDVIAEDLARRVPALLTDLRADGQNAGVAVSSETSASGSPFGGSVAGAPAADPFGQSSDPFGQSADPFGSSTADPYGAPSPGSSTEPVTDPFAPSAGSSDPFGPPTPGSDPW